MQNTYNTASAENIPSSSSFRIRLQRGSQLLVATFAALAAGLAASLMAVLLMGVLRLAAGVPTPVELFGDHVLKKFRRAANREQCLMAQRGTIRLWFKWDR